jgi:hypothetical protein
MRGRMVTALRPERRETSLHAMVDRLGSDEAQRRRRLLHALASDAPVILQVQHKQDLHGRSRAEHDRRRSGRLHVESTKFRKRHRHPRLHDDIQSRPDIQKLDSLGQFFDSRGAISDSSVVSPL